ncbi:MAG: hypothetical protein QJT81_02830 [Candidatus Thiothrix putei]|uniref:DUF3261 domain-containing protein n=1 Tax=Candidatus Thiothrix putei TaxID=3080811 RepID=A0AA95KQ80_9GAMM|nr:MAG: hypothetical protein QJT81_02830 [Candidatus Thiothrix putei]
MRRKQLSTSLLLLSLLLTGCGQDNSTPQQPPQQQQTTAPPSGQVLDTYPITDTGAGTIQLGMLSTDIQAAMPGVTVTLEQDGEGIEWMTLNMNGENLMNIMLDRSTHTANLIRILSPRFVTAQGVKVGENLQSVGEKLGGLKEIQWTEIESREFATFTHAPATMVFQVIGNNGTAGVYPNGETITTIAASSATIHSIWLMED